ncbi:MAG: hypothetical protein WC845_02740 [Candidatus Staskawiczbacteria bacterium]|jgi:F0F1-type ATP synthase epsilon subunit
MKVLIYSLKNTLFQDEAISLSCKTSSGEITVLDHHEPLITNIEMGLIKIIDKNQKSSYIQVSRGFLEIRASNEVRCIIEET